MRTGMISAWLAGIALCGCNAYAAVSPQLQQAIRASTFEVVMKKPEKDTAMYEKPLPLDLLPFRERTDAYQSIGTAFSLGSNTYVTAAHVVGVGIDGQFGMPELRGSDGTVYPIDHILRYSLHEDFVVFSVIGDPAPGGFTVNRDPKIDDPVFAVGNAFGEGVVIRDGLYTSATDEDQDGRWKWIRFSAAASPGNSGGPLLDADGKVIGIVIGKSPNENLNYSLPIARALNTEEHAAKFDQRVLTTLPYLHGTYTYTYRDSFALPLTWPAFVATYQSVLSRHMDEARAALLKTYSDSMFPMGPGSESILFDPNANEFRPYLIAQQADGNWGVDAPDYKSTSLPGDGSVNVATAAGATLLRLVRSDGAADDVLYGDSRAFMDLALKALNLRRAVGPDQVRVISLGSALSDEVFTDSYSRKWQERVWPVPFMNVYLVGELLPTPDGYSAIMLYAPSALLRLTKEQARLMAAQVGVSLSGSLKQWQAYFNRRALLPGALSDAKLERSPDWTLRTRRFASTVPASVLPLTEKSPLTLTMGFMNEASKPSWDIADVWWNTDDRMDASVGLWRRERPPGAARLELRNQFDRMKSRDSPYDGQMTRESTESYSLTRILDVPGHGAGMVSADLLYGLTVRLNGHPTLKLADSSMQIASDSTHILEHGVGADVKSVPTAVNPAENAYADELQQAVAAAQRQDSAYGQDIRGHRYSQDIREFYEAQKGTAYTIPLGSSAGDGFATDQKRRFQALQDYWRQYPSLTHNRDMWDRFLSRNGMPLTTPHETAVTAAEDALQSALAGGAPGPEWSARAQDLRDAYIQERIHLSRAMSVTPADYRARTLPCAPPSDKTTGKRMPAVGRLNRELNDFWPQESKRLGEEGRVLVSIRVSATGCALAAAIIGSSGSEMVDEAVMQYYETIDFIPAEIDGKPAESTPTLPVVFKLTK